MAGPDSRLKGALKALRKTQPLNAVATSTLRAAFRLAGRDSELVVRHLHRVGLTRVRLPNGRVAKLWSRSDDGLSNQVYWRGLGGYEPETVDVYFRLAARSVVTLDIGAHVGFYSILAALANPGGRVYAFEPVRGTFERLRRNLALNELSSVTPLCVAAGREAGTARIVSAGEYLPMSATLAGEPTHGLATLVEASVPVVTVDALVADREIPRVDLVKIDTETTEPDVLAGMARTLERDRPDVICEVHEGGRPDEIAAPFESLGYRPYLLTPQGPVLRDEVRPDPTFRNYLFTTADRLRGIGERL
jgi:FkbM family methyltransferase